MNDHYKQDIIAKIVLIAADTGGKPPGVARFEAATGIKRHEWQGPLWRNWSDAVAEAGFVPNELQGAWDEMEMLRIVSEIAKSLGRFPTTTDLKYELH